MQKGPQNKNTCAPGFYNRDCMEAMAEFPDGFFDLAIVDPPYGDAQGGQAARFGGMFGTSIDGTATRRNRNAGTTASEVPLTSTSEQPTNKPHYNRFGGRFDRYKTRQRMTPAAMKSSRNAGADNGRRNMETTLLPGMWRRRRNTSKNFSAYPKTKLYGAETTFHCRQRGAS